MFPDLMAELLRQGSSVRFRAIGASMQPTIEDGELITVSPMGPGSVKRGDILLYRCDRGVFAHRVVGFLLGTVPLLKGDCPLYLLRGDASLSCDPPVAREQVIGRVVAVQRGGRSLALDNSLRNMLRMARLWAARVRKAIREI